jgi:hypothetical protein
MNWAPGKKTGSLSIDPSPPKQTSAIHPSFAPNLPITDRYRTDRLSEPIARERFHYSILYTSTVQLKTHYFMEMHVVKNTFKLFRLCYSIVICVLIFRPVPH